MSDETRGRSDQDGTEETLLQELRQYFRALGGQLRLRLLRELSLQGERNVSQLVAALHVSQPLVSWHLRPLKKVGLVRVRRTGRQTYYALDRTRLTHYQKLLAAFFGEADDGE
jgi:DNA-binding transcriptional ArsR family regulator